MEPQQALQNSIDPADKVSQTRTIYDAGAGEIFFKNFLAGFGRAIGGLFVYLIVMGILGYYSYRLLYPQIAPLFNQYMKAMESINQLNSPTTKYQDLMQQFQQVNK